MAEYTDEEIMQALNPQSDTQYSDEEIMQAVGENQPQFTGSEMETINKGEPLQATITNTVPDYMNNPAATIRNTVPGYMNNPASNFIYGLSEIPRAVGGFVGNQVLRPLVGKEPLSNEDLQQLYNNSLIFGQPAKTGFGKVAEFTGSLLPTIAMPQVKLVKEAGTLSKVANMGLTGAYQGGIIGGATAQNNGENALKGIKTGALIGGTIGGGLPVVGKSVGALKNSGLEVLEKVTGKSRGMYNHLTSPNTKALELGMQQTDVGVVSPIQQYGMDIIKPLRQKAQAVQRLRGKTVGRAKKEVFERLGDEPIFDNKVVTSHIDDYLSSKSQYAKEPNALEKEIISLKDRLSQGEALTPKEAQGVLDELDDLINYKPSAGMNLSRQDKAVQNVAKKARHNLSTEMDNQFGTQYKNAKRSYSEIQKFATPKGINDLNGVPDTTENLISNLFRKDVPESQLLSGLKNIGGVTKGEQTQQLIELNNLLKGHGYNQGVLNKIDDYIMADKYANSFNQGSGMWSFIPNVIRQAEKPILKSIKGARSIQPLDMSKYRFNTHPLYINPAVKSTQSR